MSSQSRVLVVIPAFDRAEQLLEAIKSVLNQSYTNYSLVVVDDASSEELVSARDLVINSGHHWVGLNKNSGPAAARNAGAGYLPSDWICFLDSDDIWHPEKLQQQMQWHWDNPEMRISQVREDWFRNKVRFKKPKHLLQPEGDIFDTCVDRCAIGPSCVAIRRDLWDESGGFDEWFRVCEDYELWLRIASRETVGLVGGQSLVEKHAGHNDQLSVIVPALDRYRFVALAQFSVGAEVQRKKVADALAKKAVILAKGAARRNRSDWELFFQGIEIPTSRADIDMAKKYCTESAGST